MLIIDAFLQACRATAEILTKNGHTTSMEQVIDRYLGWSSSKLKNKLEGKSSAANSDSDKNHPTVIP